MQLLQEQINTMNEKLAGVVEAAEKSTESVETASEKMGGMQTEVKEIQTQLETLQTRVTAITGAQAKFYAKELGVSVEFTPEETNALSEIAELPPISDGQEWRSGLNLVEGTIVKYGEKNYIVLQSHISQENWSPVAIPSLFTEIKEDYAEWVQPQGGHDAYMKGDKVSYNGKIWESSADNNVWQPGVYGWVEVE